MTREDNFTRTVEAAEGFERHHHGYDYFDYEQPTWAELGGGPDHHIVPRGDVDDRALTSWSAQVLGQNLTREFGFPVVCGATRRSIIVVEPLETVSRAALIGTIQAHYGADRAEVVEKDGKVWVRLKDAYLDPFRNEAGDDQPPF